MSVLDYTIYEVHKEGARVVKEIYAVLQIAANGFWGGGYFFL